MLENIVCITLAILSRFQLFLPARDFTWAERTVQTSIPAYLQLHCSFRENFSNSADRLVWSLIRQANVFCWITKLFAVRVEYCHTCNFACIDRQDDVIKWEHFPRYWPFVREIHRLPVNSSRKGQVTQGFDVFFDLPQNIRLSKHSRRRWFETL